MSEPNQPTRMAFNLADRFKLRQSSEEFYASFRGVLRAAEQLCTQGRAPTYGPPPSNFIHQDESYLEMIWVKVSRLVNMVEVKRDALAEGGWSAWHGFDRSVFADSLIDLINYAAFWASDVLLAGQWPAGIQPQPQAVWGSIASGDDGDIIETIQCPRCQSLSRGYFGRVGEVWVIGCHSCGVKRESHQVGSLFAWYVESRGARTFRTQNGVQGDLTHHVKTVPVKTVAKPEPESRPESAADTTPEEIPTSSEEVDLEAEIAATQTRLDKAREAMEHIKKNSEIHQKAREAVMIGPRDVPTSLANRMGSEKIDDDEGPRPDVQPEPSDKDPISTLPCPCGGTVQVFLVRTPASVAKHKKFSKSPTCLKMTCSCGERFCLDMREVSKAVKANQVRSLASGGKLQE